VDTLNYFGSANSKLIEQDFTKEQWKNFTIRKEILFEAENLTDQEINTKEVEFIKQYQSKNLLLGITNGQNLKK